MAKIPSVTINVHNIEFNHGDQIVINLIEREEPAPAPQPAHRFKVGDRVVTPRGIGTVVLTEEMSGNGSNLVSVDGYTSGHAGNGWSSQFGIDQFRHDCIWIGSMKLSPAPALEPPKFYTGKVVCIGAQYESPSYQEDSGKILKIENGLCATRGYDKHERYTSFSDFCVKHFRGKFVEVKD